MQIQVLGSGSSGNCYIMNDKNNVILIDVGLSFSIIKEHLPIGENFIYSVFITHAHRDHVKGLLSFAKSFKPRLYSSYGTLQEIPSKEKIIPYLTKNIYLEPNKSYLIEDFKCSTCALSHDAWTPLGYAITLAGTTVAFITDTGKTLANMEEMATTADIIFLESNYEDTILHANHRYNPALKKRILSDDGHLSNKDCSNFLHNVAKHGKLKKCFLSHISEDTNNYDLVEEYAQTYRENLGIEAEVLRQRTYYSFEI